MYTLVEFMKTHPDAILPKFATVGSSGMDLHCVEGFRLYSKQYKLIDTGLKIALEHGYEAQVRSKSGLALKKGIAVLNSPGTIDSDYRGPVGVILINHSDYPWVFMAGDKIAQLVVKPVHTQVMRKFVDEFTNPKTDRGEGGYGSTGR